RQLRPEPQRLFRLFGLVPGPELDAAGAAALAGLDLTVARGLLDELLDRHLVGQPARGRYTYHDLVPQHACAAALAEEPEPARRAAVTGLFDYYQERGIAAAGVLAPCQHPSGDPPGLADPAGRPAPEARWPTPVTPNAALDWLESERESLFAAVRYGERYGWLGHAWRIACCLAQLFYIRGHADTWGSSLETRLTAAPRAGDTGGEACVLTTLGVAYEHTGAAERAADCQRRAIVLYQELADRAGEATAMKRLGNAHLQLGCFGQALGLYQRAHTFFRELDDPHGIASSLNNIGVAHQAFGRLSEALEHFQSALVVYQQHGDRRDQGLLMLNIGSIQTELGRYDEALASHRQALASAREVGDRWREGSALSHTGTVYRHLGQHEAAVAYHTEALLLLREVAHPGAQ